MLSRGGPCLVCGEWIEADAKDAYRVLVSNPPREAEYACHEACFERVKHAVRAVTRLGSDRVRLRGAAGAGSPSGCRRQGVDLLFLPPSSDLEYLTGVERQIPTFGQSQYAHGWVAGAFFRPDREPVFVLPADDGAVRAGAASCRARSSS